MTVRPTFAKATRKAHKLKIGVTGPSGSGKTFGALALASQLANGGKIAVIDTEHGAASLYADRYNFDTLELAAPYLTRKYVEAIREAAEAGYEVAVIDSMSHQWDGDGGILQRKDDADAKPGSNHWTNWGPFTKEHNEFRALLLSAPIHIVATMRSKMAYTQSESGGKKKVEKLGLQPIQRDGMEYEFALTFDVQMDHMAEASKDRTSLFVGKRTDLSSPATGKALLSWLATAEQLPVGWSTDQRAQLTEMAKGLGWDGARFKAFVTEQVGHYPPMADDVERLAGAIARIPTSSGV